MSDCLSQWAGLVRSTLGSDQIPSAPAERSRLLATPPAFERLLIEVSTQCNLRCRGCLRTISSAKGAWRDRHMAFEQFAGLIESIPPTRTLVLHGIGEPTLNPSLVRMVALAVQCGKFQYVTFCTNGHTRGIDYWHRMYEAGLRQVVVSVDSLTPEIAAQCREGTAVGRLERALRHLQCLMETVTVNMVASRLNLGDLPATLTRLNMLGSFNVNIQPMLDFSADGTGASLLLDGNDLAVLRGMVDSARSRCEGLRVTLSAAAVAFAPARCTNPLLAPAVNIEGYLTPCCVILDADAFGRTSAVSREFQNVWSSPPVQSWLDQFLEADAPSCRDCPLNPSPAGRSTLEASARKKERNGY